MKSFLPLLSIALIVTSCTTAYNSGQTPDDVYFSPERPQNEYVRMESKQDKYRYEESEDDRYLRMKVRNRQLWSDLSFYYNDPIAYNYYYNRYYNSYYGVSPWNHYNSWNYYYNPYSYYNPRGYKSYYGAPVIVVNPQSPNYRKPRQYNMDVYNNPSPNNSPRVGNNNSRRVFSNTGGARPTYGTPSSNTGSNMRSVFGNNNSSSSNGSDNAPTRMNSSSSNNKSSSSGNTNSSKSSNTGARKF